VRLAALITVLLLAGCAPKQNQEGPFFEPQFANLIPPDTTLLLGTSVEHLIKTPVYQKYLAAFTLPGIDDVAQRTGVDRNKKLWQVVFVSNGRTGFFLARGKFADDIMAPDFLSQRPNRFLYKGQTFYGDEDRALWMINSTTAALGPTTAMRAIVDGRNSVSAPPAALMEMMKQLPHDAPVWGAWSGGVVQVELPGNLANANRMFASLRRATMFLELSTNVKAHIAADAVDDKAAEDVYGALSSLLALAKSGKGGALYQGVSVTRNGRGLEVNVDAPAETLEKALR